MIIRHGTLQNCAEANDLVVAIDVIRAFSTAAYAFNRGVKNIICTADTDHALALKKSHPGSLAMGEISGNSIPGFDFNNSPSRINEADLTDKLLIQRTTAGTPGLVTSVKARQLLACSFVCVSATARYIQSLAPQEVFLVSTGITPEGRGDEDQACADYLEGLLTGKPVSAEKELARVRNSFNAGLFKDPLSHDFPASDIEMVCRLDYFDFAMPAERTVEGDALLCMKRS